LCSQQGFCVQGCKADAKSSTLNTEIPRAEATGRLDLRGGCLATRIEHSASGRATAVVHRDADGNEQRQRARFVCVAGNDIETPRLLLLSESVRFPHGPATGSDQLGRNYCRPCHWSACRTAGAAISPRSLTTTAISPLC